MKSKSDGRSRLLKCLFLTADVITLTMLVKGLPFGITFTYILVPAKKKMHDKSMRKEQIANP